MATSGNETNVEGKREIKGKTAQRTGSKEEILVAPEGKVTYRTEERVFGPTGFFREERIITGECQKRINVSSLPTLLNKKDMATELFSIRAYILRIMNAISIFPKVNQAVNHSLNLNSLSF